MTNAITIGSTLRKLRGKAPRSAVADACGISISALTMYETGKRIPRDEIKVKLARFYGRTVESIFFEQECHRM